MIRFLQSGNKAAKYILGGFLLVLTASMVTYLIPGFMSGSETTRSGVVATVAGQDIPTNDIQKAIQQQMRGKQIPPGMESFYASFLGPQVLRQLIQQAEAKYEANRLGLTVSDQELRDFLRTGPANETFFPGGNWIGQDKYQELLTNNGLTVEGFESNMRDQLLTQKLFETVTASVGVTPAEVEAAYK